MVTLIMLLYIRLQLPLTESVRIGRVFDIQRMETVQPLCD